MGPLVNTETRDKVDYFVQDAITKGKLEVGGIRPGTGLDFIVLPLF